jgi:hypothetical protein
MNTWKSARAELMQEELTIQRVTTRCAHCDFAITASLDEARGAFSEHECGRTRLKTEAAAGTGKRKVKDDGEGSRSNRFADPLG